METYTALAEFYKNKRVLVTGHTGFKGSYLCRILLGFGANVLGYSLPAPTEPAVFDILKAGENGFEKAAAGGRFTSVIADIRDRKMLLSVFSDFKPEIVFHLAAQPIVRTSYEDPCGTYETNVLGTVNICEAVRLTPSVKSFLNVTTDKVYKNDETGEAFTEDMPLDGFDPYSNSKSCSELVTHSYINSFFRDMKLPVSTARAGNVIGGGDFAKDRILPDCYRACVKGVPVEVRNPYSTRPFQHVLEPLAIYLTIAKAQFSDYEKAGFYNVGPDDCDCVNTGELCDLFVKYWGGGASWINKSVGGPHEAGFLKLDSSLIKKTFDYKPVWHVDEAVKRTALWYKAFSEGLDMGEYTDRQILDFFGGNK